MSGFFTTKEIEGKSKNTKISRCGKCGLYNEAITKKMPSSGSGKRKILFIGSAPGTQEDRQGEHFVGDDGQLLVDALESLKIDVDDCWSTYAVICKPDGDEINSNSIECCRPNLLKTIKQLKPNVIIPLGLEALKSLLFFEWTKDVGNVGRWVGFTIPSNYYNAWICPTFGLEHLSLIDNSVLTDVFIDHISQAFRKEKVKIKNPKLTDLENKVEIILDSFEGAERMEALSKKEGILAFDYETTGLKPERTEQEIISVSFCLDGKETFATLMEAKDVSKKALSKVLKAPQLKKVASNLKFEERWTKSKLGHGVRNWYWDTMIAAHVLDNRPQITSIKFQSYIHLGISDYDSHIKHLLKAEDSNGINRIHEIPRHDLLLYNGLDSLLEYMVMKKQRKLFK